MQFSIQHDLPEEIIAAISTCCTQGSLASLCRTSRKFNRIAAPRLYSTLYLDEKAEFEYPFKFLLPITYGIFRSADLASYVQAFVVNQPWGNDEDINFAGATRTYSEDEHRPWPGIGTGEPEITLRKRCTKYAVSEVEAEELYNQIRSGLDEDAIVPLLLASLPNLQKLDVHYGNMSEHENLEAMLERVRDRTKPFNNLPLDPMQITELEKARSANSVPFSLPIDIMVGSDADKYPEDPEHVAPFFNLPYLRFLYAWMMGDDEGEPEPEKSHFAKLRPRSCAVEYIELRCSKLHKKKFQWLMNATIPGKLKTFNYEIGCTWAWCSVDHPAMMKSLEAHQDYLECLGLSHEDFYPHQFDNNEDAPFAVSFTQFRALKKLKVAPVYIWGHAGFTNQEELNKPSAKQKLWQALPNTLKELWIPEAQQQTTPTNDSDMQFVPDCFIPALYALLERRAESFPELDSLRIEFAISNWKPEWLFKLAALGNAAESQGIACTIIIGGSEDENDRCLNQRKWGWEEDIEWEPRVRNYRVPTKWIRVAEEKDLACRLRAWWKASQKK